jgi:hypothetical protein
MVGPCLAAQRIQRTLGDERAAGHDADPKGQALGNIQGVGRHDHEAPGFDAPSEHALDRARRTGIEAGRWLVQDDQLWIVHQRAGQPPGR